VIALHSPYALLETGLRMCLPEKSQDSDRLRLLSSPFSAVRFVEEESRNTGMFRVFRREASLVSLQSRLHGGRSGIRIRAETYIQQDAEQ
jgi:hypothetical protein